MCRKLRFLSAIENYLLAIIWIDKLMYGWIGQLGGGGGWVGRCVYR